MTDKRLVFLCLRLSPPYLTLPPQTPCAIPKQFCIKISPNFPIFFLFHSPSRTTVTLDLLEPKVVFPISHLLQNLASLAHPMLPPTPPLSPPSYWSSQSHYYITLSPTFYLLLLQTPSPKKPRASPWPGNIIILLRYLQRK